VKEFRGAARADSVKWVLIERRRRALIHGSKKTRICGGRGTRCIGRGQARGAGPAPCEDVAV